MSDDTKTAIDGVSQADYERAYAEDAAFRETVDKRTQAAREAGAAASLPPELEQAVKRAQVLRTELGGYSQLSTEIRQNQNVQKTVVPRLREYVSIRVGLAIKMTIRELQQELNVTEDELNDLMAGRGLGIPPVVEHSAPVKAMAAGVLAGREAARADQDMPTDLLVESIHDLRIRVAELERKTHSLE